MSQNNIVVINKLSMVCERLSFLSQTLETEDQAKLEKLYIHCKKSDKKIEEPNKITFYINNGMSCSISTLDKYDGYVFDKNISLNLYNFYNIINNCDDNITLYLDEESRELVIGSYYNMAVDYEEMEVRIPYEEESFTIPPCDESELGSINLDALSVTSIIRELHMNGINDGFYVTYKNNKLFFYVKKPGLDIKLNIKEFESQKNISTEFCRYIPFNIFLLISGADIYNGVTFNIFSNHMKVNTKNYDFNIQSEDVDINIFNTEDLTPNDFMVVETEVLFHNLRIINAINVAKESDEILIEKQSEGTLELSLKGNSFSISNILQAASLSDKKIKISASLFLEVLDKCGIDAISIKEFTLNDKQYVYSRLENFIYVKEIYYNNEEYGRN